MAALAASAAEIRSPHVQALGGAMPLPHNRDELKADAEEIAKDAGTAFAANLGWNSLWVFIGFAFGYLFRWITA